MVKKLADKLLDEVKNEIMEILIIYSIEGIDENSISVCADKIAGIITKHLESMGK